jgi:ribosomal-protein-alanine N-acetyltransferase
VKPFDLSAFEPPLHVPDLRRSPILLRPFRISDLTLVRQASTDPYIPTITSVPSVYTDDEGRAFIERQHDRVAGGHGFSFVIADEVDPEQGLGAIGLWLREIDSGRASIGYWLVPSARGRRLATAALKAVTAFAFSELGIPTLHLFIEPWNTASARTAERAGFTREGLLRGWERIENQQRDAFSYVLLQEEWQP